MNVNVLVFFLINTPPKVNSPQPLSLSPSLSLCLCLSLSLSLPPPHLHVVLQCTLGAAVGAIPQAAVLGQAAVVVACEAGVLKVCVVGESTALQLQESRNTNQHVILFYSVYYSLLFSVIIAPAEL